VAQDMDQWWAVVNTVLKNSVSVKGWEFDLLSDYQLLKKYCAPCS
jgi:hypothetical protein